MLRQCVHLNRSYQVYSLNDYYGQMELADEDVSPSPCFILFFTGTKTALKRESPNTIMYPLIFSQVLPKSPKRGTAMHTNVDLSNVVKTCVGQDTRFPLSPLTIPETPESEKKRHCPTQPFSEAPRSPVSRSPRSRGLTCRTKLLSSGSLQPQNKTSPKSGDTFKAENAIGHFGSVKRLMRGSETHQKAKRPRTAQLPKSSEQESNSEGDDLGTFLQIIRETADLKNQKSKKVFSKIIENTSGKAKKTFSEKNSSILTLPDKILGNMTSGNGSGGIGSFTKLRVGHHKISSSEDEKENIPLCINPSMDFTEPSSENQSDLMVSYTSWVCNSDGGEKEENVFVCVNEKKSKELKNLGDKENVVTTAEENLCILDDSWFNDEMEQSFEEPEHKKSKLEYVFVSFFWVIFLKVNNFLCPA